MGTLVKAEMVGILAHKRNTLMKTMMMVAAAMMMCLAGCGGSVRVVDDAPTEKPQTCAPLAKATYHVVFETVSAAACGDLPARDFDTTQTPWMEPPSAICEDAITSSDSCSVLNQQRCTVLTIGGKVQVNSEWTYDFEDETSFSGTWLAHLDNGDETAQCSYTFTAKLLDASGSY
jgi:hypothetical protein